MAVWIGHFFILTWKTWTEHNKLKKVSSSNNSEYLKNCIATFPRRPLYSRSCTCHVHCTTKFLHERKLVYIKNILVYRLFLKKWVPANVLTIEENRARFYSLQFVHITSYFYSAVTAYFKYEMPRYRLKFWHDYRFSDLLVIVMSQATECSAPRVWVNFVRHVKTKIENNHWQKCGKLVHIQGI